MHINKYIHKYLYTRILQGMSVSIYSIDFTKVRLYRFSNPFCGIPVMNFWFSLSFLVVDDNRATFLVATKKLKKMEVSEVIKCENGRKAVRLVSEGLTQREQQGSVDVLPV